MDIAATRVAFSDYIKKRYPNDHHPSVTVSMAFFLCAHENDLGLKFTDVLSGATDPEDYRERLIAFFTLSKRKDPKGNASIYLRSFRLLREFLGAPDVEAPANSSIPAKQTPRRGGIVLPTPTADEVKRYLDQWETQPNYTAQEKALSLLFHETYPLNREMDHVLVKCSVLNDFYGTNIFGVYPIAKHIVGLQIDARLDNGDKSLVDDIARATQRRNYSFATKYCSHHRPLTYPIYDAYVADVLDCFRKQDSFLAFRKTDLSDYPTFFDVIKRFQAFYGLEAFNIKQIDQYLWQLGKDKFPRSYSRK